MNKEQKLDDIDMQIHKASTEIARLERLVQQLTAARQELDPPLDPFKTLRERLKESTTRDYGGIVC